MWAWFLQPKNMILSVLGILLILAVGSGLWYRSASISAEAKAKALEIQTAQLQLQITAAKENIDTIKKSQEQMKQIQKETATIKKKIDGIALRGLTDEEKSVAAGVTQFFNDRMLPVSMQTGDSASGGKVLPVTDKADSGGS